MCNYGEKSECLDKHTHKSSLPISMFLEECLLVFNIDFYRINILLNVTFFLQFLYLYPQLLEKVC